MAHLAELAWTRALFHGMQAVEWAFLFAIIVVSLSAAGAAGQQLQSRAANSSWWPL